MEHFIDIKLQKSKEIRPNILLNNVYTRFHHRLYDIDSRSIGVSFPNYQIVLGEILRIHGNFNDITKLQSVDWLGDLKQYCKVSDISHIPENVRYRTISRVQSTMSQAKLRRLINRGTIPEADIKNYKVEMLKKGTDNPYVELISASNGKLHRRYFQFGKIQDESVLGEFDLFGLSKESTIPWF